MMNNRSISFSDYLTWTGFQKHSLPAYLYTIKRLLLHHPEAASFSYMEVVRYLDSLTQLGFSARNRRAHLGCIKKYYDFLLETGQRKDHPCKYIQIKVHEKRNVIHQDLFSISDLQTLLSRPEYWPFLATRNRLVISLMIYQALMPYEIVRLKMHHIDLDRQTVYLSGSRVLQSRTLPLVPYQLELLDRYLHEEREHLLQEGVTSDFLFVCNKRRTAHTSDNINYLVETLKPLFPQKNLTAKGIRDSVINHWLNEKKIPLDQVQLMAGHRWVSSTLRYKRENPQLQRELMNRFFPVK